MDGAISIWVDVGFEMDGAIIIWVDGVIMHWTISKATTTNQYKLPTRITTAKNTIFMFNDKPDLTLNINGSDLIFIFYDVTIK